MAHTDPRVDAYITKSAPFAQPILQHIRKAVHAGCPEVEETIKWSFPHFVYKGMLCSMASFKAHCAFGFWKGSLLKDELGESKGSDAMGQFGRITALDDLPPSKQLVALVRKAAALNEEGVKVVRRAKTVKAAPVIPAEFSKMLRPSKKALATFMALSASHQREYLEWFGEAKTVETRQRRMTTALEWLSEGKARNWKYERKR
jgi:hypothetical protein